MSKAKMEARAFPKRFYKRAAFDPVVGGYAITLDGKELKTQGRNPLRIASAELAEAVAAEWNAQQSHINPDTMPLSRLVNLTIDRGARDRAALVDTMVAYAETDLLCYRANDALAARQHAAYDPLLAWAATMGIVLEVTEGVMPIAQPAASLQAVRVLLELASDAEIIGLAMLVPLLGSTILALAIWQGRMDVEQAMTCARLDEVWQAEKWGADEEAEAMWNDKQTDIRASAFFLTYKCL